jgi:hypothetical protein
MKKIWHKPAIRVLNVKEYADKIYRSKTLFHRHFKHVLPGEKREKRPQILKKGQLIMNMLRREKVIVGIALPRQKGF